MTLTYEGGHGMQETTWDVRPVFTLRLQSHHAQGGDPLRKGKLQRVLLGLSALGHA